MALAVGPTHAARWFELRLSRARLARRLPAAADGGQAGLIVYARDRDSGRVSLLAQEALALPAIRGRAVDDTVAATLPPAPFGALRAGVRHFPLDFTHPPCPAP